VSVAEHLFGYGFALYASMTKVVPFPDFMNVILLKP
jgi:hypothetical protein